MKINQEKQQIIDTQGNILVTANPGTGKTLLLAHKYISLIKSGVLPEEILCLTFTEKAKREMEERILTLIKEKEIELKYDKLNVFTFHSYALNSIDNREIISSNLLRFSIYLYVKENQLLNYSDSHILSSLVPKIDNLIRYLKSFGITPDKIDNDRSKKYLEENETININELEIFLDHFVNIFRHYELIKSDTGYDYADLLIEFSRLKDKKIFNYVLVDELQDVNKMEADIALESAKHFIAVGDKKQAIFGFQGGSILNFESFSNSKPFVLSDNFRSTNEILDYSKEYFIQRTKDESIIKDLEGLKNAEELSGNTVKIIEAEKNNIYKTVKIMLQNLLKEDGKTAVVLRTNDQILKLSNELDSEGIDFTSTHLSGSAQAKEDLILFLEGLFSSDVQIVKNSMFSSFFPISIQKAFEIAELRFDKLSDLLEKCPEFNKLRMESANKLKIIELFKNYILPVSLTYGKDNFIAAKKLMDSFIESFSIVKNITFSNIVDYLKATELNTDDIEKESEKVVLTTVHKSKGREYDNVIYLPTTTRNNTNFVDNVVKAILHSKGINVDEELEEESLRVNFVAFTRAKNKLFVLTEKAADFVTGNSELKNIEELTTDNDTEFMDSQNKAFNFFINHDYQKAIRLLESDENWLVDYIKNHFDNLTSLSFSNTRNKAFEYLQNNILKIREFSPAMKVGNEVHLAAETILRGKKPEYGEEIEPYVRNIHSILAEIGNSYPEVFGVEKNFKADFRDITDEDIDLRFSGKIDAVFKNSSEYLILDWKTDRDDKAKASVHRQQLESYKKSFCYLNDISEDQVNVGIAYIGLRSAVRTDSYGYILDDKKPSKNAFNTFLKRVKKINQWKNNPVMFLEELIGEKKNINSHLWRSVVEQYLKEKDNS